MDTKWLKGLVLAGGLIAPGLSAQQNCPNGIRVEGAVRDPTGAVIAAAQVRAASGEHTTTDTSGHYVLPCIPSVSTTITVEADGFSRGTAQARNRRGGTAYVNLQLAVASVQSEVQVGGDSTELGEGGAGATVLGAKEVQQLPDDPDDLLRVLQSFSASSGGNPAATVIVVDGFQSPSAMPPKSSIASIRINPDFFAPEYQTPNWSGGRIEITTKPGADRFLGALFFTDSNGLFNATDPFSTAATPAGKKRYGFELTGPILRKKLDFSLALERREIDEFNIVNAMTLDANENLTPLRQTVSAPQRLWIGSARGDWQANEKDIVTLSYSGNVNDQGNMGVGGLVLQEAGYSSDVSEYDLRLTNAWTLNANTLHETRIGYSWKRTQQAPNSLSPNLQVAGYFTGGGATSQNLNDRERDLEVDDDLLATRGKHEINLGFQSISSFVHDYDPNTFNGAYVFGGGSASVLDASNNPTSQTTTITGIDQYRRALLGLSGGEPTTYEVTTGTPLVPLSQFQLSWYAQDVIKMSSHLTVTGGFRYQIETNPSSFANFRPRIGLMWSPDKKGAGAWIETLLALHTPRDSLVAPLAGAWIETPCGTRPGCGIHVAPLAGAWIETDARCSWPLGCWRRSPRGSVD